MNRHSSLTNGMEEVWELVGMKSCFGVTGLFIVGGRTHAQCVINWYIGDNTLDLAPICTKGTMY